MKRFIERITLLRAPSRAVAAIALLAAVAGGGWWAIAQSGAQPASFSEYMPAGALLYLESANFAQQLNDWNSSSEKAKWLDSANRQVFLESRLGLKLKDVYDEFAAAAGFGPNLSALETLAGDRTALAVYDIGNLNLLYISRLPGAKLASNALTTVRSGYAARSASGQIYYLRTAGRRTAAFAVVRDTIVLSTEESLLVSTLALMAGANPGVTPIRRTAWFEAAIQSAGIDANSAADLRLAMDLPAVIRTPHFRSYWIQRNASELRQYASFVTELHRQPNAVEERRTLVRNTPKEIDAAGNDAAMGELRSYAPSDSGLYRLWQSPPTAFAAELIRQKLLDPAFEPQPQQRLAAEAMRAAAAGSDLDLMRRIDQPPLPIESKQVQLELLRTVIDGMPLRAALHLESSVQPDGFSLPATRVVLAFRAGSNWDAAAVRAALTSAVAGHETVAGLGLRWKDVTAGRYTFSQWDGLHGLAVYVDGSLLVLSNSSVMLAAALDSAANSSPAATPVTGVYLARYNHARELQPYLDTMRMLDFQAAEGHRREPYFFSENIGSLALALESVRAVSAAIRDDGAAQHQTVRYER